MADSWRTVVTGLGCGAGLLEEHQTPHDQRQRDGDVQHRLDQRHRTVAAAQKARFTREHSQLSRQSQRRPMTSPSWSAAESVTYNTDQNSRQRHSLDAGQAQTSNAHQYHHKFVKNVMETSTFPESGADVGSVFWLV
jgi:hypothetical protein